MDTHRYGKSQVKDSVIGWYRELSNLEVVP